MEIGKLNRRVTIQRPATGDYSDGQPAIGWTDVATVWANVRYLNGIETVKADAATSVSKASIRIRRRTDVLPTMRVVLGTTNFNIQAVLPDEQDRERLDLACEVIA